MSRAARITVGAVVAGTLAFVALVAGVMAAVGGAAGDGFLDELGTDSLDAYATAEVLDVDDDWEWPTVDVRWTTPDDEVVVTFVDWEWTEVLPEVGDDVEVVYDSADPEWAFAADDPFVDSVPAAATEGPDEDVAPVTVADDGLRRTAGWVSLAALLGLVLTVALTVVAALRAPTPEPAASGLAGPYGPGSVGHPYPPAPAYAATYPGAQPYPGAHPHPGAQPYPGAQPHPTQPFDAPQPHPQPYQPPRAAALPEPRPATYGRSDGGGDGGGDGWSAP